MKEYGNAIEINKPLGVPFTDADLESARELLRKNFEATKSKFPDLPGIYDFVTGPVTDDIQHIDGSICHQQYDDEAECLSCSLEIPTEIVGFIYHFGWYVCIDDGKPFDVKDPADVVI